MYLKSLAMSIALIGEIILYPFLGNSIGLKKSLACLA
jgi:hypothetical protein